MKRIELRDQKPPHTIDDNILLEGGCFHTAQTCQEPFSLFAPLHYERNYAYPLLIWLHGSGGDERQLRRIMPLISMRNYVAAAPRGTGAGLQNGHGYSWADDEVALADAANRVFGCLDAARRRFHIAAHRVYLAGFGCGGTTAFRVALQYPQQFAGALSICGPFPENGRPLAALRQARQLPLFIAQGRDSEDYSLDRTCEELRLFHAAGLSVTLRQYPCGDEMHAQMLHDMDVWIMEQVTGVSSESNAE